MMKKIFLSMIRFYQKVISPYSFGCCRFTPTCSVYAYQAIEKFGCLKGVIFSVRRLLRCNMFNNKYGYDPVPEKFDINVFKNLYKK